MKDDPQKTAFLLKCMMDNMSDMIYFKDRNSRFIMVNKAAAQWQGGFSPEELIGQSDFDSYSVEDAMRMRHDELRIMQKEEPLFGVEEDETRKDGSHVWVSSTKMPLRNEVGEVIGIFGISRDITNHKEAELRAEKLAEENSRFRSELEEDLLMASQLQKTFFPSAYPQFQSLEAGGQSLVEFSHFHRPGGLIGGDLCSIRKLSETEAGIFLCDVMGHGVRAALGTSIVRAVVEEISNHKKDPGDFLHQMNQMLMPLFRQEGQFLFATACYMVLDVSSGRVRIANAGHPMPIVLDAKNQRAEYFGEDRSFAGPGLAICEDATYETIERTVGPGDAILAYTDGINEAENSKGEEFGEERLIASALEHIDFSLPDLFSALYQDACKFGGSRTLEDDVCLAGFRING